MLFGDAKTRQMARSILPSTTRWAPQHRPRVHRWNRHAASAAMRALTRDPSAWDDGLDAPDLMQREIGVMVRERRHSDKLNHFERWAVERTREMPAESRLGHLAALLPPGLIGDHAYGHLEHREELMSAEQYARKYPWRTRVWTKRRTSLDAGELCVLLRELLEVEGGHRAFNAALKYGGDAPPAHRQYELRPARRVRLLLGAHDVRAFVKQLATQHKAAQIADTFLRCFKATRDVAQALAAAGVTPELARVRGEQLRLAQRAGRFSPNRLMR